jgi:hypothetical protein
MGDITARPIYMHRNILPSIMRGLIVVLTLVVAPSSVLFVAFFISTVRV